MLNLFRWEEFSAKGFFCILCLCRISSHFEHYMYSFLGDYGCKLEAFCTDLDENG